MKKIFGILSRKDGKGKDIAKNGIRHPLHVKQHLEAVERPPLQTFTDPPDMDPRIYKAAEQTNEIEGHCGSLLDIDATARTFLKHANWWCPPVISSEMQDVDLNKFSPYTRFCQDGIDEFVRVAIECSPLYCDAACGAMVGMAIGDAVGCPLEFLPVRNHDPPSSGDVNGEERPRVHMSDLSYDRPLDRFKLQRGQWTDDASMGLCLADSLLASHASQMEDMPSPSDRELIHGFDGSDARMRWHAWWVHGYNTGFEDPVRPAIGLGRNISMSIFSMKQGDVPSAIYESTSEDSGNGSLMRLAAVPVTYWREPEICRIVAMRSSLATHPGTLAARACEFWAWLVARAISEMETTEVKGWIDKHVAMYLEDIVSRGIETAGSPLTDQHGSSRDPGGWRSLRRLLESNEPKDSTEVSWNWRHAVLDVEGCMRNRGDTYNGYRNSSGYFGSFSLDAVAISLHAVYHTESFTAAIEKCVNFLGDADSTGAICGQLAGAFYKYRGIPDRCRSLVRRFDHNRFALVAALLCRLRRKK